MIHRTITKHARASKNLARSDLIVPKYAINQKLTLNLNIALSILLLLLLLYKLENKIANLYSLTQ